MRATYVVIPEVIVIHRATKAVEASVRGTTECEWVAPASDGRVASSILESAFSTEANPSGGDPSLRLRRLRHPDREGTA